MNAETPGQRIERLAKALSFLEHGSDKDWEEFTNAAQAVIASDKKANWPFLWYPETHVIEPTADSGKVLSELESAKAERENLKDREIALLEQAVVEAAQLNELKKEAERMKAVVETVREYFACGGRASSLRALRIRHMRKALKELDKK